MASNLSNPDKSELRSRLVAERNRLDDELRRQLNSRICTYLLEHLENRDVAHLAAFFAFNGEPDLIPVLEAQHHAGRHIYLPVVDGKRMIFRRWSPGTEMQTNRFGIPEPVDGAQCPAQRLDIVLLPLVAYSANGTRLGMGAGFYDRTFAFRLDQPKIGPQLIGSAYSLQEVDHLPAQSWDVPLDAVMTDQGLRVFRE